MTEAEAWMLQVESDFAAAAAVLDLDKTSTYCQAISKYQQVVEKSINVIDAVLREQGIVIGRVRAEHYPLKMINRLTSLSQQQHSDLAENMQRLFRGRWYADIRDICQLAPKLPQPGDQYRQNTEYPYQNADTSWTAPANNFTLAQVQRFGTVARSLRREVQIVVTAAKLNRL